MDDYYNYMPEGTNSNNVPDENNTDVFQAIAGFGWGKKFGTILDTVKKQSEVFVDVTKRDLTEFVTVVRDDTTTTVDTLSHRINDLAVTAQHTLLAHPSASSSTTTATSSSSLSTVSDPTPSDPSTGESSSSTVKDGTPASAEQAQGPVPEPSISASASASAALSSFIKSATSQLPTITLPTAIANIDLAAIRERLDQPVTFEIPATIGGVDLVALRERLEQPVHFSDIRLPGGVDLAHLREEISQGTRFAEQYLGRFGEEITAVLTNAVTVTPPEEQGRLAGSRGGRGRRIITNRKDALLAKLRGDSATYLTEPVAAPAEGEGEDHDAAAVFATFAAAFSVAEYTEDIARLLNEYPEMRKIMERIVPVEVPYNVFWLRYYYRVWQVEQEEERRKQLVKDVATTPQTDEELFNWDMEEEDDPALSSTSRPPLLTGLLHASTTTGADHDPDELVHVSQTPSTEPSLISPVTGSSRAGDTDDDDLWGTEVEESRRDEVVKRAGIVAGENDGEKGKEKGKLAGPSVVSSMMNEDEFEVVNEKGKKRAAAAPGEAKVGASEAKVGMGEAKVGTGKARERPAGAKDDDDWSDWE